ncbi:MAG: tetratricopeptide repeat protein [Candidatus Omnitrophota bacterium]|nr:tetratricopeptide repeat protein [Candidatus Omnitrophota bacterium]
MRYILISLVFIVLALLLIHPAGEADTWMHIKTGQIMLENMRVTSVDDYSYTRAGEKWINHQWLSQAIFYVVHRASGINGLVIFTALVLFSAFTLLFLNIYRKDNWLWAVFLFFLVILFSQNQFLARPLVFSIFLFSLFIFILLKFKYTWQDGKENILYALVPLQILWSNLHAGSIMGVFLVWAFIAGEFIDAKIRRGFKDEFIIEGARYKKLLFTGSALLISTGLTPYGYEAILFPLKEFSGMYFISEWLPSVHKDILLNFGTMPYFRAFLLISIFVFIFRARRISSSYIIIFAGLLYLSLSGKRHLALFGIAIAPSVAEYLRGADIKAVPTGLKKAFIYWASIAFIFYLAFLAKDILAGDYYVKRNIDSRFGLGRIEYPESAMDFLEGSGLEGNMFNDYASGCYLIHRFYPAKKVFIDGRNTIYGVKFIKEDYVRPMSDPELFENLVKRRGINYAFIYHALSNTAGLIPHLYGSGDWKLVYLDDMVCVFARDNEKNAGIIRKYRVDIKEKKPITGLNRYSWQKAYPWGYINRAFLYEALGLVDMAIDTLRHTAAIMPYVRDVHYNLGTLYLKKEMYPDAVKEFREAVKLDPKDADAHNNLGIAYINMGEYKDAMREFRRAVWLNPLSRIMRRNLSLSLRSLQTT